jgi:hypothetical protein
VGTVALIVNATIGAVVLLIIIRIIAGSRGWALGQSSLVRFPAMAVAVARSIVPGRRRKLATNPDYLAHAGGGLGY